MLCLFQEDVTQGWDALGLGGPHYAITPCSQATAASVPGNQQPAET